MKNWPIVIGLALMIAVSHGHGIAQEPSTTEPRWIAGDMWTYSVAQEPGKPAKLVTIIVVDASDVGYTIRTINPDGHYEISSVARSEFLTQGGFGGPPLQWPMAVGQHWSGSYSCNPPTCSASTLAKIEYTVEAFELVSVPAGALPAFRLTEHMCFDQPSGSPLCGNMRIWFAPKAKTIVKVEIGAEKAIWGASAGTVLLSLVSYAVAP